MTTEAAARLTFKQRMLIAREGAIVQAVNRLLAEKGFEAMTVDEVAAHVGIAKASLYKHFHSKEDLAGAAMVRVLRRARDAIHAQPPDATPVANLRSVLRWVLQLRLAGDMPPLPSQHSSLRTSLLANRDFMDSLMDISDTLGEWIEAAQVAGQLNAQLPARAILYTLYARACDPLVAFLKVGERFTDEQVVEILLSTCFDGLNNRKPL